MAINLSAEQKTIRQLFYNTDQFVIPEFQRTYSWGYEQCDQLYRDIVNAAAKGEDYFLGNVVMARSDENKTQPQIVDGQQRIISLWILLKILSVYVESIDLEDTVLKLKAWKKTEDAQPKIISCVGEQKDGDQIAELLTKDRIYFANRLLQVLDKAQKKIRQDKCMSNIEYAALLFYYNISQADITDELRENLTMFLLDNVSLLPIEMGGRQLNEARERALMIFETINNRGMDLVDADIFKSRLFSNAMSFNQEKEFVNKWLFMTERVNALGTTIDEVFRCYYHIIRGEKGITSAEMKLRDFFLKDKASPLTFLNHDVFMDNLGKVINALERYTAFDQETTEVAGWMQVLNAYTNNFPKYAVIAYLYKYPDPDEKDFLQYIKSIARYVYYTGSTTTVKFGVYSIIQRMAQELPREDYYQPNLSFSGLSTSSRLISGYSLIAYYQSGNETIKQPVIEKLIYESEVDRLTGDSNFKGFTNDDVYTLGNTFILRSSLRGKSIKDRLAILEKTPKVFYLNCVGKFDSQEYNHRQNEIQDTLLKFFRGNERD